MTPAIRQAIMTLEHAAYRLQCEPGAAILDPFDRMILFNVESDAAQASLLLYTLRDNLYLEHKS